MNWANDFLSHSLARSLALLLATASSPGYTSALGEPLFCKNRPARGLRPDQEKLCNSSTTSSESKSTQTPDRATVVVYPVTLPSALLVEGAQPVKLTLEAYNNKALVLLDPKTLKEQSTIRTSDIVQWVQGDFSGRKFSGGAAAAMTATYVGLGALTAATGGLGAPLLLLAPLAGWYTGNQFVADHRFVIRYIDENTGDIQFSTIQLFGKKESSIVAEILLQGTGLKSTKKREDSYLAPIRKAALARQEGVLYQEGQKLMTTNPKKPWCSKLDLSGNTGDVTAYNKTLESIARLRKLLGMDEYKDSLSSSSDQKWLLYLSEKPDLQKWATVNKAAAQKLKTCS